MSGIAEKKGSNEALTVDLAGPNCPSRQRKLRKRPLEKAVTEDEFESRLRERFVSSNPATSWAKIKTVKRKGGKKSKVSSGRAAREEDDDGGAGLGFTIDRGNQGRNDATNESDSDNDGDGAGGDENIATTRRAMRGQSQSMLSRILRGGESLIEGPKTQKGKKDKAALSNLLPSPSDADSGAGATPSFTKLPYRGGRLNIAPMPLDGNAQGPSKGVVRAATFHPVQSSLLMTAGMDKTLRFFMIDGETNPLVHSVYFKDMPIHTAAFVGEGLGSGIGGINGNGNSNAGSSVVCGGRRPFLYWYDCTAGTVYKMPRLMGRTERSYEKFEASPDGKYVGIIGDDGYTMLVSTRYRQLETRLNLKMNGSNRALCFGAGDESRFLYTSGSDAEVYVWDLRLTGRGCLHRFPNEGGTTTSAMAVSAPTGAFTCGLVHKHEQEQKEKEMEKKGKGKGKRGQGLDSGAYSSSIGTGGGGGMGGGRGGGGYRSYLCVGSESGVVNLYDTRPILYGPRTTLTPTTATATAYTSTSTSTQIKPLRSYMNLTTPITAAFFSPDAQLLCFSSRFGVNNALRMAHLETGNVFSNWPTTKTPLKYVFSGGFSPGGGYLVAGNDKGRALMYRIRHFPQA